MKKEALAGNDGLLSEIEQAKRLRVHPRTMINWRARGLIPYFKIGRRILYRSSDVDRILDERYRKGAV